MKTGVALLAIAIGSASSACSSLSQNVKANGELLEARTHSFEAPAGYSVAFDKYMPAHTVVIFDGHFQGDDKLDELDFFAIAGDEEATAKVIDWRTHRNNAIMVGWGANGVGFGLAGAGAVILAMNGGDDFGAFSETQLGQASFGMIAAGGIIIGASFFVSALFDPEEPLTSDETVMDISRAGDAAAAYNAKLRGEAPVEPTDAPPAEPTSDEPPAEPATE